MKKRLQALLLAICMVIALLPTGVFGGTIATGPVTFADDGQNICANGIPIRIVAGSTEDFTNILYDKNNDGTIGDTEYLQIGANEPTAAGYDLTGHRILGGQRTGNYTGDSTITIEGGNVNDVMGGNFSDELTGNVTITMNGGSVSRLLACGYWGQAGGADKTASIIVNGGTVRGGEGDDIELNARMATGTTKVLTITGGTIHGTIASAVAPTNGTVPVCKTTPTLIDGNSSPLIYAPVSGLTLSSGTYGMKDVKTNIGDLSVYLPAGTTITKATAGGVDYINTDGIVTLADGTAAGNLTAFSAPVLSECSAYRNTSPAATVYFAADVPGTYYYQVTDDDTAPDAASIETDKTGTGTAVAGTNAISLTGLAAGNQCVHIVVKDASNQYSNVTTAVMPYDQCMI